MGQAGWGWVFDGDKIMSSVWGSGEKEGFVEVMY